MLRATGLALLAAAILGGCGGEPDEDSLSYKAGYAYAEDAAKIRRALSSETPSLSSLEQSCYVAGEGADRYGRTWENGDIEAGKVDVLVFKKGCLAAMEDAYGHLRN